MKLDELVESYSRDQGLVKPDATNGIYRFTINNSVVIALEGSTDQKGFFLYSVIGSLPPGRESEIALKALNGNLFGKETGKGSIGYDPVTNSLVLYEYFSEYHTDLDSFKLSFRSFVQYLVYWIGKLG